MIIFEGFIFVSLFSRKAPSQELCEFKNMHWKLFFPVTFDQKGKKTTKPENCVAKRYSIIRRKKKRQFTLLSFALTPK